MPALLSPDVKTRTLELLRGGTLSQTKGQLLDPETGCRCVLGVIALAANIPHDTDGTLSAEGEHEGYAGFEPIGLDYDDCVRLYKLNDREGLSFPELADHIEANL